MDERVGVHHFDSRRKRQRFSDVAAADAAELQCQHGTDAFAAARQTVAHGFADDVRTADSRVEVAFNLRQEAVQISHRNSLLFRKAR